MGKFRLFDQNKSNMISSADYEVSSFRLNGGRKGMVSSAAFNKVIYQLSAMTTALANMMEAKGYTMDDCQNLPSLATLQESLANIMTRYDMSSYASLSDLSNYLYKYPIVNVTVTPYTIQTTDLFKTLNLSENATIVYLPAAASVANGSFVKIKNSTVRSVTIANFTGDTIDGVVNLTLAPKEEVVLFSAGTGTAWYGKKVQDQVTPEFVQKQADYAMTDEADVSFIKNKPNLSNFITDSGLKTYINNHVLTTQVRRRESTTSLTATLSTPLSVGTWLVFAWMRGYCVVLNEGRLYINSTEVDYMPRKGDTQGTDYITFFGTLSVSITTPTVCSTTYSGGGLTENNLMLVAIKVVW